MKYFFILLLIVFFGQSALSEDLSEKNFVSSSLFESMLTNPATFKQKVLLAQNKTTSSRIRRESRERRRLRKQSKSLVKAHYGECKDVNLSSLTEEGEDTTGKYCFICPLQNLLGFKEIKQATNLAQSNIFEEKLQKRVMGQIEAKVFQIQMLRACMAKDRSFFEDQGRSWSIAKENCEKKSEELKKSVQENWPQMRVDLALSRPAFRESRILTDRSTWFDVTPSHSVSNFDKLPKLNAKEIQSAEQKYMSALSQVPLENMSASEFRYRLKEKKPLQAHLSPKKHLTAQDQVKLRDVERDLRKQAKQDYLKRMSQMPLLGYLKSEKPSQKEWGEAFSKVEDNLQELLEKAKDSPPDMGLLLSFSPLVKEMLKEDKGLCLSAEKARLQAKKKDSIKNWALFGAGILGAVPCFMTGPIGASVCLSAGVGLGVVGHGMAKSATDESLARLLTGEDFETMAGLEGKAKEEFLAKLFLPLAAWGTTAVPVKSAGVAVSKAIKNRRGQNSSSSSVVRSSDQIARSSNNLNTPVTASQKNRMLKTYDSLLKNRSTEEQNVIMSAIRGMESKGLNKEKISEKISQATKQCRVK